MQRYLATDNRVVVGACKTNPSLQRTSSGKDSGKSGRPPSRLPLNSARSVCLVGVLVLSVGSVAL